MKKLSSVLAIAVLCVSANALAGFEVAISPPNTTLTTNPGKKIREVVEVKNEASAPVKLKVYVTGYQKSSAGNPSYESGKYSAAKWITVSPDTLSIRQRDYGVVRFEVQVPSALPSGPGSYSAAIMLEQIPGDGKEKKEGGAAINILGRLAHIVNLDVGNPTYSAQLTSFSVNKENAKDNFLITIKNNGSFDYPTEGFIKIYSGDKKIKEVRVPRFYTSRANTRTLKIDMPKDLKPGTYRAELDLGDKKQGKINASANFTITPSG